MIDGKDGISDFLDGELINYFAKYMDTGDICELDIGRVCSQD